MNLNSLLSLLWRKKWVLITVPIIAVIAALIFRMTGDWKFRSSSLISTGLTISDDVTAGKYLNPYEVQVSFNNLIETVKSRTVIDQAGYKLAIHDLENRDTPFRKLKPEELQKIGVENLNNPEKFLQILKLKNEKLQLLDSSDPEEKKVGSLLKTMGYDHEKLLKELTMSRVNQSDFIEVSFVSENPMLSAFVVNTVCAEFIRYYTSLRAVRSNSSVESLEFIAAQRKDFFEQRQQALQEFKLNTDIVNSKVETEGKLRKKENYEEDIATEQQNIRSLELTLISLDDRINRANAAGNSNRNAQIIAIQRRIDKINSRYIVDGQKDKVLSDSVTMLRAQLTNLVDDQSAEVLTPEALGGLRERRHEVQNQLNIAKAHLETLYKDYNTVRYRLGSFASKEAMSSALEDEVEAAREEYISAQNRLSAAKEKALFNRLPIQQVLKAEPADKAESNKTLIFMIFSGALSFIFSVFAIVAIDVMDSRIKTPERLKMLTRMKIAGVFPKMPLPKSQDKTPRQQPVFQLSGARTKGKDEIRKIRYEIERSNARTILATSTKIGQGKSFFVRALAYSFSLQKKRVLIIDTNFRNNSLTQIFVAQPALKLLIESFVSERKLLTSSDTPQQPKPKNNMITHTENNWVDFIGNKQVQTTPSELINGEDFSQFIEWLKTQYHYIILEGPALNNFSDTKELIPFVDVVIPVFSADSSIDGEDAESLNYLKSLQSKLGPAVLNNYEKPK
jgi:polysaccharide biosynthesis transport protein